MPKISPDKTVRELINTGLCNIVLKQLKEMMPVNISSGDIFEENDSVNLLTFAILTLCTEKQCQKNVNTSDDVSVLSELSVETLKHSIKDNFNVKCFIENKNLEETLIELYKNKIVITQGIKKAVEYLFKFYPNILDVEYEKIDIVYFLDSLIDKPQHILEDRVDIRHLYPGVVRST